TVVRADGERKLKILAIGKRMFEGRPAVLEFCRLGRDRDRFRKQNGAATTLLANVVHVRCEAVANIDHGVQLDGLMQLNRFTDARREIEVLAKDAAAERTGHEQPIARTSASARHGSAAGRLANDRYRYDQGSVPAVGVAAG